MVTFPLRIFRSRQIGMHKSCNKTYVSFDVHYYYGLNGNTPSANFKIMKNTCIFNVLVKYNLHGIIYYTIIGISVYNTWFSVKLTNTNVEAGKIKIII
jgi:hypothetical protein